MTDQTFYRASAVTFTTPNNEVDFTYNEASIDQDLNQVTFPEGYSCIGKSIWTFENPADPNEVYAGVFPGVSNISDHNESFTKMVQGELISKTESVSDKYVYMIIAGSNGCCRGAFGLVTHNKV